MELPAFFVEVHGIPGFLHGCAWTDWISWNRVKITEHFPDECFMIWEQIGNKDKDAPSKMLNIQQDSPAQDARFRFMRIHIWMVNGVVDELICALCRNNTQTKTP